RRRQRPLRVEALGLGDQVNALDLQPADGVGDSRIHLAGEPDESLRSRQLLGDLRRRELQDRRESLRRRALVFDLVGYRVHGGHFDRAGELPPLPVHDRSAAPGDLDAPLLLALRAHAVLLALDDLELDEAADDERRPKGEAESEQAQPLRAQGVHLDASSAALPSMYWTWPGRGGFNPLRVATSTTRDGAEARTSSA